MKRRRPPIRVATVLIPQWLQDCRRTTREVSWAADEIAAARRALRDPAKTLGRDGRHDRAGHPRSPRPCRRRSGRRAVPQHDPDPARPHTGDLARGRRTRGPIRAREPSLSALPVAGHAIRCGPPVFNTVFNYVNYHPFAELAGITGIELLDFEVHEQTNFALLATVGIDPRTQRLFLRRQWRLAQVVTATQSTRIRKHFLRALAAIVRSPEQARRSRHQRVDRSSTSRN